VQAITPVLLEFGFPLRVGDAHGVHALGRALVWQEGERWIAQAMQPFGLPLIGSFPLEAIDAIVNSLERKIELCLSPGAGVAEFRERVNALFLRFAIRGLEGAEHDLSEWEDRQQALHEPEDVDVSLRFLAQALDIHRANWWTMPLATRFRRFIVPLNPTDAA
jgi:hypothetical protein